MTGCKANPEAHLEEAESSPNLWHGLAEVLGQFADDLEKKSGPAAVGEFKDNVYHKISEAFKTPYDTHFDSGGDSDDAASAWTEPSITGEGDLTLNNAASGEGGPAVATPGPDTSISATETKSSGESAPHSSLPSFAVADCNQQGISSQNNLATPATRDSDDHWDPAPHTAADPALYTAAGNEANATIQTHYGWVPAPAPTAGNQAHTTAKPYAFWAPFYSLPQAHNGPGSIPQHAAIIPVGPQPSFATVAAAVTTTEPASTFPAINVWSAETQPKQPQAAAPNAEHKPDEASNADAHHALKSEKLSATPTLKTPSPSGLSPKAPVFTPKTLESSSPVNLYKPPKNTQAESDKPQATPLRACFHCGLTGHFSSDCQVAENSKSGQSGGQDSNPDNHLPPGSSDNNIPTGCYSAGDSACESTQEENGATAQPSDSSTTASQCSCSASTAVPENKPTRSATEPASDGMPEACPVAILHEGYKALAVQWSDRLEDVRQHVSAEGMLKFFALNNSIFDLIDEQEYKEQITLKLLVSASKGTKIQVKPSGRNWAPIYAAEIKAAADDRAKARAEAFHTVAGLALGMAKLDKHREVIDTCLDKYTAASF